MYSGTSLFLSFKTVTCQTLLISTLEAFLSHLKHAQDCALCVCGLKKWHNWLSNAYTRKKIIR